MRKILLSVVNVLADLALFAVTMVVVLLAGTGILSMLAR